jgi:hypothetical protein
MSDAELAQRVREHLRKILRMTIRRPYQGRKQ